MVSIDGKTDLLRYSILSLTLILLLTLANGQPSSAADLPMPADKSVAVPADPEAAAPAAPAAATSGGADTRPYAEEAFKHYNRGVELHQAGFLNQAIAEYKSAIEADGRMEEAWSNLGGIYAAQRSYPKAMEAFEKALQLKPDRPTTLNGYGTVLYARGKTSEAKEKWKQAVQIEPGFASAYYNMGNALEGEKDVMTALAYYYLAIQANPNMADAYYRMGNLLQKDGHSAAAKVLLQRSTELSPDAEFSRDAKKQITSIDTELSADKSDKSDLQMNVIAPSNRAHKTAAAPEEPTATASATKPAKEHHGLFSGAGGGEKKAKEPKPPKTPKAPKVAKQKKEKSVDMFVQSPDQKVADPDLTEKPAQ
ncbi:MAG: tetratricopeptide repeat protein [Candidatus Melainabacteria bacterium]|nr:tetratricopeptide repeat protein [Candidatus Melainabacteria bacterium]